MQAPTIKPTVLPPANQTESTSTIVTFRYKTLRDERGKEDVDHVLTLKKDKGRR